MGLIVQTSTQTDAHTVKQMLVASFMSMNKLSRGLLHFLQGWRVIQRTVAHKRGGWIGRGAIKTRRTSQIQLLSLHNDLFVLHVTSNETAEPGVTVALEP